MVKRLAQNPPQGLPHGMLSRIRRGPYLLLKCYPWYTFLHFSLSQHHKNLTKCYPWYTFVHMHIVWHFQCAHKMLSLVHVSPLQPISTCTEICKNLTKCYPWYTSVHMHFFLLSSEAHKIFMRASPGVCKNAIPGTLSILFRRSYLHRETSSKSFNIQYFY